MKRQGVIGDDPNYKWDYTSLYIPKKDIKIFGTKLVAYAHEYMTTWIGCCVRYGASLILKQGKTFDKSQLNTFADHNACAVKAVNDIYFPSDEVISALKINDNKEKFIILSCREGDVVSLPDTNQPEQSDEIQQQYLKSLKIINLELDIENIAISKDYKLFKLQDERELLELNYRGKISYTAKMDRDKLENEEARTKENIKNLNRDKENLKLDALKFYNGKMPKWLSEKWQEEEANHLKTLIQ